MFFMFRKHHPQDGWSIYSTVALAGSEKSTVCGRPSRSVTFIADRTTPVRVAESNGAVRISRIFQPSARLSARETANKAPKKTASRRRLRTSFEGAGAALSFIDDSLPYAITYFSHCQYRSVDYQDVSATESMLVAGSGSVAIGLSPRDQRSILES